MSVSLQSLGTKIYKPQKQKDYIINPYPQTTWIQPWNKNRRATNEIKKNLFQRHFSVLRTSYVVLLTIPRHIVANLVPECYTHFADYSRTSKQPTLQRFLFLSWQTVYTFTSPERPLKRVPTAKITSCQRPVYYPGPRGSLLFFLGKFRDVNRFFYLFFCC